MGKRGKMSHNFMQETQLTGGPLVVSHAIPSTQTVALGIFIDIGSRDETPQQEGIAHALEHMLFKGTKALDVHALSEKLDLLGGNANAFTSRERTCFHLQVLHEDWQEGLGLLMDMLLEPALPEDEWQREREVIFSEMGMVDDAPDEWVYDQHMKAVFAGQSVGKPTLGSKEVLAALSAQDLRDYLQNNYCPPRLLIVASGRIKHDELLEAVQQRHWPRIKKPRKRSQAVRQSGVQSLARDMEQAHIIGSFEGIHAAADVRPAAWLANQMLGGGMSSALFREVRERRGLAYGVSSHLSPLSDVGLWSVSCATHPSMLAECMGVLKETLQNFPNMLDEALLQRSKRQMEVQFRMAMDSIEGNMLYLGARLDEEHLLSQQQWVEAVQQVKHEDVCAWVEHHLNSDAMWTIAASDEALSSVQSLL